MSELKASASEQPHNKNAMHSAPMQQVTICMLCADFIYSEYASTLGHVGNDYRKMVWQIAEDYACASVLLRLPGYSPMPAFGEVIDVPLVLRHAHKSKAQVSQAQSSL